MNERNRSENGQAGFAALCRERGLRMTPQRALIHAELAASRAHPSAEDLHRAVAGKMPGVSLDTVYRTLEAFERAGLVDRVRTPGGKARFEGNLDPHHHVICRECGRIEDVCWPQFDGLAQPEAEGFAEVSGSYAVLCGLCLDCAARGDGRDHQTTKQQGAKR